MSTEAPKPKARAGKHPKAAANEAETAGAGQTTLILAAPADDAMDEDMIETQVPEEAMDAAGTDIRSAATANAAEDANDARKDNRAPEHHSDEENADVRAAASSKTLNAVLKPAKAAKKSTGAVSDSVARSMDILEAFRKS